MLTNNNITSSRLYHCTYKMSSPHKSFVSLCGYSPPLYLTNCASYGTLA